PGPAVHIAVKGYDFERAVKSVIKSVSHSGPYNERKRKYFYFLLKIEKILINVFYNTCDLIKQAQNDEDLKSKDVREKMLSIYIEQLSKISLLMQDIALYTADKYRNSPKSFAEYYAYSIDPSTNLYKELNELIENFYFSFFYEASSNSKKIENKDAQMQDWDKSIKEELKEKVHAMAILELSKKEDPNSTPPENKNGRKDLKNKGSGRKNVGTGYALAEAMRVQIAAETGLIDNNTEVNKLLENAKKQHYRAKYDYKHGSYGENINKLKSYMVRLYENNPDGEEAQAYTAAIKNIEEMHRKIKADLEEEAVEIEGEIDNLKVAMLNIFSRDPHSNELIIYGERSIREANDMLKLIKGVNKNMDDMSEKIRTVTEELELKIDPSKAKKEKQPIEADDKQNNKSSEKDNENSDTKEENKNTEQPSDKKAASKERVSGKFMIAILNISITLLILVL
ncbi:hypothetical protein ENBRE01_3294, partial [Enteropsectra breve]